MDVNKRICHHIFNDWILSIMQPFLAESANTFLLRWDVLCKYTHNRCHKNKLMQQLLWEISSVDQLEHISKEWLCRVQTLGKKELMNYLPFFPIKELILKNSSYISVLPEFTQLNTLNIQIRFYEQTIFEGEWPISFPPSLRCLRLRDPNIKSITIPSLLERLHVDGCTKLIYLLRLPDSLSELKLSNYCDVNQRFCVTGNTIHLKHIDIQLRTQIPVSWNITFPELQSLVLRTYEVGYCSVVRSILKNSPNLRKITLIGPKSLRCRDFPQVDEFIIFWNVHLVIEDLQNLKTRVLVIETPVNPRLFIQFSCKDLNDNPFIQKLHIKWGDCSNKTPFLPQALEYYSWKQKENDIGILWERV